MTIEVSLPVQMKDVIISVTGVHQGPEGPDSMQLVTAGRYGVDQDEIRVSWEETELTGSEGTRTSLSVQPRSVVLSREGAQNSVMEFEEGRKHYFLYETPVGSATMGLDTRSIRKRLDQHGGDMLIEYTVDVDQRIVGRDRFFISVREPRPAHTDDVKWPM